jgi:hypothetical protein
MNIPRSLQAIITLACRLGGAGHPAYGLRLGSRRNSRTAWRLWPLQSVASDFAWKKYSVARTAVAHSAHVASAVMAWMSADEMNRATRSP